jgi:hypothetical protein
MSSFTSASVAVVFNTTVATVTRVTPIGTSSGGSKVVVVVVVVVVTLLLLVFSSSLVFVRNSLAC